MDVVTRTPTVIRNLEQLRSGIECILERYSGWECDLSDEHLWEILDTAFTEHAYRCPDLYTDSEVFVNLSQNHPTEILEQCWYSVMDLVDTTWDAFLPPSKRWTRPSTVHPVDGGLYQLRWTG